MSTNTFIKAQHNVEREEEEMAVGQSLSKRAVHRGRLHGAEQQRREQHRTPPPSTGVLFRGSAQLAVDFALHQEIINSFYKSHTSVRLAIQINSQQLKCLQFDL